jgi:hypothetical protein
MRSRGNKHSFQRVTKARGNKVKSLSHIQRVIGISQCDVGAWSYVNDQVN